MPRNRPYKTEFIDNDWFADEITAELNDLRLALGRSRAKANQLEGQLKKWRKLGKQAQSARRSIEREYCYSLDEGNDNNAADVKNLYYTAFGEQITSVVLKPYMKQHKL